MDPRETTRTHRHPAEHAGHLGAMAALWPAGPLLTPDQAARLGPPLVAAEGAILAVLSGRPADVLVASGFGAVNTLLGISAAAAPPPDTLIGGPGNDVVTSGPPA